MSRSPRLVQIEYLRGIAAFSVLGFHSLNSQDPRQLNPVLGLLRSGTTWGWLGVHIFFVISGWCIAERIAAAQRNGESP
jgi:peptidoglycan/LPS O-acetylase OafA/YrhL